MTVDNRYLYNTLQRMANPEKDVPCTSINFTPYCGEHVTEWTTAIHEIADDLRIQVRIISVPNIFPGMRLQIRKIDGSAAVEEERVLVLA